MPHEIRRRRRDYAAYLQALESIPTLPYYRHGQVPRGGGGGSSDAEPSDPCEEETAHLTGLDSGGGGVALGLFAAAAASGGGGSPVRHCSAVGPCIEGKPGAEDSCSICLMEFSEGAMVKRLRCGHIFDPECIDTWLRKKNACPMCKRAVVVRRPAPRCHIIRGFESVPERSQSAPEPSQRVPESRLMCAMHYPPRLE